MAAHASDLKIRGMMLEYDGTFPIGSIHSITQLIRLLERNVNLVCCSLDATIVAALDAAEPRSSPTVDESNAGVFTESDQLNDIRLLERVFKPPYRDHPLFNCILLIEVTYNSHTKTPVI